MRFDGQIDIRLQCQGTLRDSRVCAVTVESSRQTQTAALLSGRTVPEALQLIGMVFGICGNAQSVAAVRTLEAAMGVKPDPDTDQVRQAVTDIETLREHLWRILLGWPAHTESTPDHATLAQVLSSKQQVEQALGGLEHWLSPGATPRALDQTGIIACLEELQTLIETRVLGVSCEEWLMLASLEDLIVLIEQHPEDATPAVRLLRRIIAREWTHSCFSPMQVLPSIHFGNASELIKHMQDPDYIARPQWHQRPCESTSYSRSRVPLTQALRRQSGSALLVRATALLSEVALLTLRLTRFFASRPLWDAAYPQVETAFVASPGQALGQVCAARGQLFHWASVSTAGSADGKPHISEYRILAPTEWNFHPAGVIPQALAGLAGHADDIRQQAALLIELVDPCVGYQLTLMNGDNAHA